MKKGKVAEKSPQMVELESGIIYAWFACGQSSNQPWCNGAQMSSEFAPQVFKAEESKTVAMCMCKQTNNPPYCDGAHMKLN
ncbi:MAG: CDGSH iron-sulfur domain-containing protein [Cryomorphaceae bacterium]